MNCEDYQWVGDYTIVPERGGEANNGVSTIDLILISQHILGVKLLDSPYKIIAADVNRSKSVTTLDLIELRKIILRIKTNMPKDGLPWRFVPASFEFEDPQNPFKRNFPEVYNVNDLEWENLTANFVAIKIGDVNNSAVANRKGIVQNRADLEKWEIVVQDQEFKAGSSYTIDFIGKNTEMVSGYQFTLDFDPDKLEVLEVIPGDFPNMTMDHFGLQAKKDGLITTSWTKSDDGILREEAVIFSVECKAKEDSRAGDVLALNSKLTEKEAYDYNLEKMNIHLVFDQESIQDQIAPQNFALEVYQNRPNPFYDRTSIPFDLSNSGQVEFKVFDAMGKLLLQKSDQFNSGRNQIEITKEELNGTGIFYYQIETAGKRTIKKMIVN